MLKAWVEAVDLRLVDRECFPGVVGIKVEFENGSSFFLVV
jgi:hypothetical protein